MQQQLSGALVAETYGTFVLTLLGPLSITIVLSPDIFPAGRFLGLGFIGLAHGVALLVGIASVARVSGAHFNPAVTLSLAYSGRFPKNRVAPYITAQLVGGIIAAFVQLGLVGTDAASRSHLGTTIPNALLPLPNTSALLAEIVGTFILAMTVLGSSDSSQAFPWAGSSIGLALSAVIWSMGAISGASLNPARTFGPSFVSLLFDPSIFTTLWIYVVGPVGGGLLAAEIYTRITRG